MAWHNTRPRERSRGAPAAFIDPCIPAKVAAAPAGNDWAHEIKHDGYRIQVHVTDAGVRLYTMSGYDWTDRYPLIVNARGRSKAPPSLMQRPLSSAQMASVTLKPCITGHATRKPSHSHST
jgi:ATP-dependent DNA ligase